MAEKLTREIYTQYARKIVSVLSDEAFYNQYKKRVEGGASNFKLVKKRLIQDISLDWIDTIEDCLPNLDTIVRNPRKFIVQEEDIVDVSLAKSISTESVKHLAQHTNMISKVDEDGMVTPNRILNITKEESFEIYENRFIYTLLLKVKDFVTNRYDKIKKASATQDVLNLDVDSRFNLPSKKINFHTEYVAQLSFDEVMQLDPETLEKIERVAKIDRIVTDFLSSSFAKSMRNSAPVRPPITRTNVILKEPNFKKALTLWQFVETYQQAGGFSTSDEVEDYPISTESTDQLKDMIALNTMLFESMYDQHETDFDMADAEFADMLKVGEMDFKADELDRDEYAQKLDEEEEKKEADKQEEVKPPEEEKEEKEEEEQKEEQPPEPEEKEVDKDVDKDVEVETPPHEEQEDTEPDADEFDRHLFEVRKIYKRPKDDKIRQDEIAKVKDAVDRCLTLYRKIKQDEVEEYDREERRRIQAEEIAKRAEAFRRQRDAIEAEYAKTGVAQSGFMGVDPFVQQAAKIILPTKDKNFKKKHSYLFVKEKPEEKLDLEDKSTGEIIKGIAILENELAEKERVREEEARLRSEEEAASAKTEESEGTETEETDKDNTKTENNVSETEKTDTAEEEETLDERFDEYFGDERDAGELTETEVNLENVTTADISADNASDTEEILDERFDEYFGDERDAGELTETGDGDGAVIIDTLEPETFGSDELSAATEVTNENAGTLPVSATVDAQPAPKPKKTREPVDPWGLSPTTINQKYSKASGKSHNIDAVDEKKVAVGGIRLAAEQKIDPFGAIADVTVPKKNKKSTKNMLSNESPDENL